MRLSFSGGRVDAGDASILSAAKREVLEETGHDFNEWRLVKVYQPHTKMEWFIHVFLAWDLKNVSDTHLDGGEKIQVMKLPFDEVKKQVFNKAGYLGEVQDLFDDKNSITDLLSMSEFSGREI